MDYVKEVKRLISEETKKEFNKRVEEQARNLSNWLKDNKFSNKDFSVGLELEAYVVDNKKYINKLPTEIFQKSVFEPELGKQNLEINTFPHGFNNKGVEDQKNDLLEKANKTSNLLNKHGLNYVLDSLSTNYEDPIKFFSDVVKKKDVVFAKNMTKAPRYYALDNASIKKQNGSINFSVPGVDLDFPSILFESLATSMQVHLQVPQTNKFFNYYNTAIRTMPPILALSTNSPFLPPSFYKNGLPNKIYHENRIPIFEQCVNPSDDLENKKVRVPADINSFIDLTSAIAKDEPFTACLREWRDTSDDEVHEGYWEWNYKLREYWRWLRPVIGGESVKNCCSKNSLRVEYRPLPTQPSVYEIVSLQLLTAGLIHGLVKENHPLLELSWKQSKKDFYGVMRNGIDADLHWITKKGDKTTKKEKIYKEVFYFAKNGLRSIGLNNKKIKKYLHPIEQRYSKNMTPSKWKINRVKEKIQKGKNYKNALIEVNKEYQELSNKNKLFIDWL